MVAGSPQITGTASGSTTISATAAGSPDLAGTTTGSASDSGTVTGTVGYVGSASGTTTSTGSATGTEGDQGVIAGVTTSTGTATGSPDLAGQVLGSTVSTGTAAGTGGDTPTPTPIYISSGGGRVTTPRPILLPQVARNGRMPPRTYTREKASGRCGYTGNITGSCVTGNTSTGTRWPSDQLLTQWAEGDELLTLGLLDG